VNLEGELEKQKGTTKKELVFCFKNSSHFLVEYVCDAPRKKKGKVPREKEREIGLC